MIRAQVLLAALLVVGGCTGELIGDAARQGGRATTAVGASLQALVLERAEGIAPHNRPYVYNGVQDCYGYVRQVINPFLVDGTAHPEDYWPNAYDRTRWLHVGGGLPTGNAPSSQWAYFSSASELLPGDVLATAQGHAWGPSWHGGIFAGWSGGAPYQWDNTTGSGGNGAYRRPLWSGFHYYYRPLHELLAREAQEPGEPTEPTDDGLVRRMHGTVTVGGEPVEGILVSAWGHDLEDYHETTTDGAGVFALTGLNPDSLYNVVVNATFNTDYEGNWQIVDESHAFQVRDNVRLESGPDGWHGEWFLLDY